MKSIKLLFCLIIFSSLLCSAQTISKDLALYIKAWGLARYNNCADIDEFKKIDSTGFYGITKLLYASNRNITNRQIKRVISIPIKENSIQQNVIAEQTLNLDTSWISNNLINKRNSEALRLLVNYNPNALPPAISEKQTDFTWFLKYYIPSNNDTLSEYIFGIGLIWNHIEFFYLSKDKILGNWADYLEFFLNKFMLDPCLKNYELILREMLGKLNDGHAEVSSYSIMKTKGFFQMPWKIRSGIDLEDPIVIKTYYNPKQTPTISIGDRIQSIDGLTFKEYFIQNQKYFSGNLMVQIEKACSDYILSNNQLPKEVKYSRHGINRIDTIQPIHIFDSDSVIQTKILDSKPFTTYGDTLSYINLNLIEADSFKDYWPLIKESKCIIVDLRFYPNNLLDTLANYLFPDQKIISQYLQPNFTNPGYISDMKPDKLGIKNGSAYKGILVVLVNHNTFSQGEYIALALSSLDNSHIVGSMTSGTDGNTIQFELPCNVRGKFTALIINDPNLKPTFFVGLKPDVVIPQDEVFKGTFDPELFYCLKTIRENWGIWINQVN